MRCDPDYCDGPDAESFRSFMARLRDFHGRLLALDGELCRRCRPRAILQRLSDGPEEGFARRRGMDERISGRRNRTANGQLRDHRADGRSAGTLPDLSKS